MSDGVMRVRDISSDIRELMDLLAKLFDTAKQLPPGSERAQAMEEISGYQRRLSALIKRNEKSRAKP
ncbi:hypothetical protein Q2941_39835 [Bradyrhizobium sp. UFLA05-153]